VHNLVWNDIKPIIHEMTEEAEKCKTNENFFKKS